MKSEDSDMYNQYYMTIPVGCRIGSPLTLGLSQTKNVY